MAIQDDRRELEMCALLGLRRGEGRSEVDAFLDFQEKGEDRVCPVELKGYTRAKMLEILKLRVLYVNHRGSTLNNPHIPKSFFAGFSDLMLDVHGMELRTLREVTQTRIRQLRPQVADP